MTRPADPPTVGRKPTVPHALLDQIATAHQVCEREDPSEIEDYDLFERLYIRYGNLAQERGDYVMAQDMQLGLRRVQLRKLKNLTIEDPYHRAQLALLRGGATAMATPRAG